MKTTYFQPPDMKGKKTFLFRCGCCEARNCLERERERLAWKEAKTEMTESEETIKPLASLISDRDP